MLASPVVDEDQAKMSSKNEVIKFDVVVVGSCMTDLVRYDVFYEPQRSAVFLIL